MRTAQRLTAGAGRVPGPPVGVAAAEAAMFGSGRLEILHTEHSKCAAFVSSDAVWRPGMLSVSCSSHSVLLKDRIAAQCSLTPKLTGISRHPNPSAPQPYLQRATLQALFKAALGALWSLVLRRSLGARGLMIWLERSHTSKSFRHESVWCSATWDSVV